MVGKQNPFFTAYILLEKRTKYELHKLHAQLFTWYDVSFS